MKKIYKKLTEDQKKRGVIFSSTLSEYTEECLIDNIHEVLKTDDDNNKTIDRLMDDSFFNASPIYKFNIIRQ